MNGKKGESKYSKGDKVILKRTGNVKVIADVCGENRYYVTTLNGQSPLWVWWHEIEPYTEQKEPTIKVGDKVAIKQDVAKCLPSAFEPYKYMSFEVTSIHKGFITAEGYGQSVSLPSFQFELIQSKSIADKIDNISEETANNMARMLEDTQRHINDIANSYVVTEDAVGITLDKWWQYEADLAKEIALKVANKYNDPKEAAEYAVSVAKAVVENLKKK